MPLIQCSFFRAPRVIKRQNHTEQDAYHSSSNTSSGDVTSTTFRRMSNMHPEALLKVIRLSAKLREETIRPKIYDWFSNTKITDIMREWQGYHKLGLRHDDLWSEFPHVQEACRRLPRTELIARTNRIREALVANSQLRQLEPHAWTTPDQDCPYLQPYITEVQDEWSERKAFRARIPPALTRLFNFSKN